MSAITAKLEKRSKSHDQVGQSSLLANLTCNLFAILQNDLFVLCQRTASFSFILCIHLYHKLCP